MDPKKRTLASSERDEGARGAWRERLRGVDPRRLVLVDECSTNVAMVAPLICSISLEGVGPSLSIEGAADGESFRLYVEELLCPVLPPGRIVVMDNLSVHKSRYVRELVEGRGCELWFLPAYSPDLNPIEEAFSKAKGIMRKAKARTLDALFEATHQALCAVTGEDARGFFAHSGYEPPRAQAL